MKHDRQQEIKQLLFERGQVTCKELCERFGASIETVRRDLAELEKSGCLRRTYGGATLADGSTHPNGIAPWSLRASTRQRQKRAIAKATVEMIPDNVTVVIDSGTTMLEIAKCLSERKNLKVITNDVRVAETVCERTEHEVFLIGGVLKPSDLITFSYFSADSLNSISAIDIAILSGDGFCSSIGLADHNYNMCHLKAAYIQRSEQIFVAIDSSKFSIKAPYKVCDTKSVHTVITDDGIARKDSEKLRELGVRCVVVKCDCAS